MLEAVVRTSETAPSIAQTVPTKQNMGMSLKSQYFPDMATFRRWFHTEANCIHVVGNQFYYLKAPILSNPTGPSLLQPALQNLLKRCALALGRAVLLRRHPLVLAEGAGKIAQVVEAAG